jgi:hypothetical protein
VVGLRVSDLLADQAIADLYAHAATTVPSSPPTLDLALDQLRSESGFDPRWVNDAIVFADTSALAERDPYVGAVVRCSVPAKQAFELLRLLTVVDFEAYEYGSTDVYHIRSGLDVAFLSSTLVVVGSSTVVQDVVNNQNGSGDSMSAELRDAYVALGSDSLVRVVSRAEPPQRQVFPVRILPDMSAGALRTGGSTAYLQVDLSLANDSAARETAGVIQSLIADSHGAYPQPEIGFMLDAIMVATHGATVSMQLAATVDQIAAFADTLLSTLPGGRLSFGAA